MPSAHLLRKCAPRAADFFPLPIGTKITLLYAAIFAIILTAFSGFVMLNSWYFYKTTSEKELEKIVDSAVELVETGGMPEMSAIDALKPDESVEIRIINVTREVFYEHKQRPWQRLIIKTPDQTLETEIEDPEQRPAAIGAARRPSMHHERIVKYGGEEYLISVSRPYNREQGMMKIFARMFIIMNILSIVLAYGIGKLISKSFLKPITNITKTAETIGINDLSQRIDIEGPDDEIKNLAVTFNDMIGRLEASFNKQNQFISDASHELRTPISVIQGYANLIDRWGKSDPVILQEAIDSIKDETEHMSTLIKKLLFLARDEQNKKVIQMDKLSVNFVANEVIKEMTVLEMNNKIELTEDSDVYIEGDFDLIKQMLWIFLENAIKYTGDDGKILLNVGGDETLAYISVSDNGIGIKEEDLPYIFDRFYRGDKSRSKEIPGTGLGLSIADWIIHKHKGSVSVESKVAEGSRFTVAFPLYNNNNNNKKERQ